MASSASLYTTPSPMGNPISPEVRHAVEMELDAICSDVQFRASQRNCAFLRYVITETLAGRADEIKERTLGKELFGRPISYDTGSDAVVRVRANEVRKRLIGYYQHHESQAGWRVQLPLRTYVPAFVPEDTFQPVGNAATTLPEMMAMPDPVAGVAVAAVAVPVAEIVFPALAAREEEIPVEALAMAPPVSRMVIPTLVALFLCAATFRWQAFSGTPYLDFWEALLEGHSGIALVLDADPADPHAVTTSDLETVKPLLETAALFHASTEIGSTEAEARENNLLAVHITHHAPKMELDDAAYVTLIPGHNAQLWVGSRKNGSLELAIHSIANTDLFPTALDVAVRRKTPTRLRFAEKEQVTSETLPAGDAAWKF